MNMKYIKGKKKIYVILLVGILCFIVTCALKPLYVEADNYAISIVTNGLYGKDNYCIYLHPFLCCLIRILISVFPCADGYLLLTHSCIFIEMIWLLYLMTESGYGKDIQAIIGLLIFFLLTVLHIWNGNFTVQAASFTLTGMVTLLINLRQDKGLFYEAMGALFVCLGFMWRIQAAMLFIPYILLEVFFSIMSEQTNRKEFVYKMYKRTGICLILLFTILISLIVVKKSDKYSASIAYDEARIAVEDFPVKDWNQVQGKLEGKVSEVEYHAARDWMLADTEHIDVILLQKMAEAGKTTAYPKSAAGILEAVKGMWQFVVGNSRNVWILVCSVPAMLGCILASECSRMRKFESILACLGTVIILLYFTMLGRAPLHVWTSVIMANIGILILQFPLQVKEKRTFRVCFPRLILGSMLSVGILYSLLFSGYQSPQFAFDSRKAIEDLKYQKTYQEDSLYLWEPWLPVAMRDYMQTGKLPTKEFMRHNIPIGDWCYGQVYFNNHLHSLNAENPARALIEREHTYLIAKDTEFMLEYLRKQFDSSISVEKKGEIKGIPVWKFSK